MDKILRKLKVLADAAKYDVSCVSSGVGRKTKGKIGNSSAAGICHTWGSDGRCISLLKILMTNNCAYDCQYCINRITSGTPRASFTPEEIAKLTIEFYRRNYIEGLFLSSAIEKTPDYTMERICEALELIRKKYDFSGYIHIKAIPGADPMLIKRAGFLADRMSVNIELPSERSLSILAPQKNLKRLLLPMKQIKEEISHSIEHRYKFRSAKEFVPAGQSTQMIIGATPDTDYTILQASNYLYKNFNMKRVFFSAYVPVLTGPNLPSIHTMPPLKREHRLYQADWLLRFYKFDANELLTTDQPNFDLDFDPKINWAFRNIHKFPVDINKASYDEILRIPGIGVKSADRIIRQRKVASISYDSLKTMRVALKRAKYFVTFNGKYYGGVPVEPEKIKSILREDEVRKQISIYDILGN